MAKFWMLSSILAFYIVCFYIIDAIPRRYVDNYNPNATYVPVIGPFGYYATPAPYVHGTCEIVHADLVNHSYIDVNEKTCGIKSYIHAIIRHIFGDGVIPACFEIEQRDYLNTFEQVHGVLCDNGSGDKPVSSWPMCYHLKLQQATTTLFNITINFINDSGRPHGAHVLFSSLTFGGSFIYAVPRRVSCDYLVQQNDNGTSTIPADEVFLNKSEVREAQDTIPIKLLCFSVAVLATFGGIWYQYRIHGAYVWGMPAMQ